VLGGYTRFNVQDFGLAEIGALLICQGYIMDGEEAEHILPNISIWRYIYIYSHPFCSILWCARVGLFTLQKIKVRQPCTLPK
jgi:hypothetical protein